MKLHKDLREFLELLNSHKVDFVLVGGHAVAFHGYPRYTGDIDFLVRPDVENGRRIVEVMEAFGFDETGIRAEDFIMPDRIIQLGYPPNRIDLITSISACSFDEVWESRVETALDNIPVFIIGKDTLVKNKQAANRIKDILDVEKLKE
jgi:hypothetical protein